MSKYLTIFNTEAQWQAAQDSLDYPNVSLIETTGDLHYGVYHGKEIANAAFGDIILCSLSDQKLFNITNSEYNISDYPIASFEPIGICIFDKESHIQNKTIIMSLKYMNFNDPENGSLNTVNIKWGQNSLTGVTGIKSTSTTGTVYNSKEINEGIKLITTVDWSGSTIQNNNNRGSFPAFECCWRFHTPGTSAGDWYLPSYYDIFKYKSNQTTIKSILTNIASISGVSYGDGTYHQLAYEYSNSGTYMLMDSSYIDRDKSYQYMNAKAVMVLGVEEV